MNFYLKTFGKKYLQVHGDRNGTPYIHIMICHFVELLKKHSSISKFSQQGFEATHKWHRKLYYSSTNRDGGVKNKEKTVQERTERNQEETKAVQKETEAIQVHSSILQVINKSYRVAILQAQKNSYEKKEEIEKYLNN